VTAPGRTRRGGGATLPPGERAALVALAVILAVTASWWAAALWPLPATTPDWVVRARAACFGVGHSGLPHAGGWILLVGSPVSLLAALAIIAGRTLRTALDRALATWSGRATVSLGLAAFVAVLATSGVRAAGAAGWSPVGAAAHDPASDDQRAVPLRPLNAAPGALGLRDHRGELIEHSRFAGRPVLVTFAFGRCESICPVIVQESLAARAEIGAAAPPLVIITLDPWRDAPPRLPHIADAWQLDARAHLLGGDVAAVERVLDSWNVERTRDPRTGDVVHPSLVYLLDEHGRIRYAVPGWRSTIVRAVHALDSSTRT
jgi:cytochrome oxidase Cu insertion factor (SCO1/SenC/PrrC family)